MNVLVTGGAGYIGAHVIRLLRERGDAVVIIDDVVTGDSARVPGVPLVRMDLADLAAVDAAAEVLRQYNIDSVIHLAARKQVAESVERPAWYYQQNVGGIANLLLAMEQAHVTRLVFSSSAAVYGASEGMSLAEDEPVRPVNPYGETKLIGEWLVENAARSNGLAAASLRYFNVAGAGWPELGDNVALNLVPMVFERLDRGEAPLIFGRDYPTADGTCIRDYIHVLDLAEAHLAILDSLRKPGHDIYNVGSGTGWSVLEMVKSILSVTGIAVAPEFLMRRAGDPAAVVADAKKIQRRIGWKTRLGLVDVVSSAWESHLYLATRASDLVG